MPAAAAFELAPLCAGAATPSAERPTHADALFEIVKSGAPNTKALQRMLERARAPGASQDCVENAISAALAIDALSDRRPVSTAERERVEDVATIALERSDIPNEKKALALAARARLRLLIGQADSALADLEKGRALLARGSSPQTRAIVAARYGYALMMAARLEESLAAHRESSELTLACGDVRAYVSALQDEGNLLQQLKRVSEARARFDLSREQALAVGDVAGEMRAHAGIAFGYLDAFEFEASRDAYAAAAAIGENGVAPRLHALVLGYSAVLHLEHDRLERAIALAARAVAISSQLRFRLGEGFFAAVQAAAHARRGDVVSAHDRMRFALSRVPPEHVYVQIVRLYEAQVEVETGGTDTTRRARARAVLEQTRALSERLDDARVAARILRARLAREESDSKLTTTTTDDNNEAPVESEASVSLTQRLDARRMLSYLRVQSGKPVSVLDLARYVWSREVFEAESEPLARGRLDELMTHANEMGEENVSFDERGYFVS